MCVRLVHSLISETFFVFCLSVYLNVTNIETYNVGHDKFCIKWTPHRAATSYRIKLNPVDCKFAFLLHTFRHLYKPIPKR